MNMSKLAGNPRMMKALTGMCMGEFDDLLPTFEKALLEIARQKKGRRRKPGGGQKGHLKTAADKLFFVLLYAKTYPTFDVLAFWSEKGRGRSCEAVRLYLRALRAALGREVVLPERKIRTAGEFLERFPEVRDVFIDGTERRIQRPKGGKRQNKLYSGKKKANTRKNVVVSDERRRILYVSPTKSGRRHDKRILDKADLRLPDRVGKWVDTGFQGLGKALENVVMPKKGTRRNPLTQAEKAENRLISSIRVVIEHALAGIKRFRVLTDVLRNKIGLFDDMVIEVCSGLWNFHLRYAR
jgi:hypothetical protein